HRGERRAVVERQVLKAEPAELDVPSLGAPEARDVKKDVLSEYTRRLRADELEADRRRDAVPRLARADGLQHLDWSEAARGAVQCARGDGVRIGAGEGLARKREAALQDDLMADAVVADVVEARDAESLRERPGARLTGGITDRRRRYSVIEDHRDAPWVGGPLWFDVHPWCLDV